MDSVSSRFTRDEQYGMATPQTGRLPQTAGAKRLETSLSFNCVRADNFRNCAALPGRLDSYRNPLHP